MFRISVITPTWRRQHLLPGLCRAFKAQTHEAKELLIYDDSPVAASCMEKSDDCSVHYFHRPVGLTIGEKRNWLIARAGGDVIAHFDDDDYYAPEYLSTMARMLGDRALVTMDGWFLGDVRVGQLFYWDTLKILDYHFVVGGSTSPEVVDMRHLQDRNAWRHRNLYGYGFSYVYSRRVAEQIAFDAMDKGEDYAFATACLRAGLEVGCVTDRQGMAVHLIHGANSSRAFPNYRVPWSLFPRLVAAVATRKDVTT